MDVNSICDSDSESLYEAVKVPVKKGSNMSNIIYVKRDPQTIKIKVNIPEQYSHLFEDDKKTTTASVYETNTTPGFRIRNAITGMYYSKYRVGSYAEDRFFKVCWATGHEGRSTPIVLFFSSPEDFEKHMLATLTPEVKQEWRVKQIAEYKKDKLYKDVDDDNVMVQLIHNESRRVIVIR